MGRIKLERCQFKECINLYVQAETKFINYCRILKINYNTGATAFYHLRMAQVLEICGLVNSADYHYQQGFNLFTGINPLPTGVSQVKLSLSQQESQIKESIQKNIEIGYSRGYLLSCTKLFTLYANQLKIYLALRFILRIIFDVVRDKSINITFSTADFAYLFILSRQMIFSHYGLGIYTRSKILQLKLFKPNEMITVCPCPEPDCKKHIRVVVKEQ